MRVIPIRPELSPRDDAATAPAELDAGGAHGELWSLLCGRDRAPEPLPPIADVLSAAVALAEGTRRKSLLPLGAAPAELVLLRRGTDALVSYYRLDASPDVRLLDRPLPLRRLLDRAADAAERLASRGSEPTSRELVLRLAERARSTKVEPERDPVALVTRRGGATERPRGRAPLAFGFEATVAPVADPPRQTTAHSDVHALLFSGRLWLWARGRRIPLLEGPIMLAVVRMVVAVRALVEARAAGRAANVRLRAGRFVVGVRLSARGDKPVQLSVGSDDARLVTVPELTVAEAALPILRLASELLRTLVSVDRSQARNLRVSSLREEVRSLRRDLRRSEPKSESVVNEDSERLRAASAACAPRAPRAERSGPAPRALLFDVRWEEELEGLDASSTFLCGDRLVVATPRQTAAFDRDDGHILWAHEQPASASFMAGTVLVQLAADGALSLSSVIDGEPFARCQLAPRVGGPPSGILAGGRSVPPVAVLAEGRDRLVAVDLRTGELRWRFWTGSGSGALRRVGRILLAVCGDGTLCALDVANGELLWRLVPEGGPVTLPPAICGDVVVAASGGSGSSAGAVHGVDLFSGRVLWSRELDAPPSSAPIAAGSLAAIAVGGPGRASLAAFDPERGSLRWMVPDPGVSAGGCCLGVDHLLVINGPTGSVEARAMDDGQRRWERSLSHPVADDVPRRLEPVLRGGALFIPSASVHVLRPHDGSSITDALPCELVPDWMRVDERGWVYVAEESGHFCGLAPRPHLSLVRG